MTKGIGGGSRLRGLACGFNAFVVACFMGGCCKPDLTRASAPIPLKDALGIVEKDLREAAPVTLSDADEAERSTRLLNAVALEQCRQETANPLIPVVNGPINLQLQGQIQVGGNVGFTVSATPSVSAQGAVQRQEQQQVAVPISFVSLVGLPNFYMGQNMANLANVPDGTKYPPAGTDAKKDFAAEILVVRKKLVELTKAFVTAYPLVQAKCAEIVKGHENIGQIIFPAIQ